MNVGLIIVDYGDAKLTQACLESLVQVKTIHDVTLYIVGKELRFDQDIPPLAPYSRVFVPIKENKGFAYANNRGIEKALAAGAEAIVLLNNDTIVDPGFLDPLINALQKETVGLVSSKIYFYPGKEYHKEHYHEAERGKVVWYAGGIIDWDNIDAYHWGVNEVDHGQFNNLMLTDFATGCALAISAKTLAAIKDLPETYFLYWEDVEWSVKAQRLGLTVVVEPHSKVWHINAGTAGGPGSPTVVYYQTRNRIYFGLRYAPLKNRLALLKSSIINLINAPALERRAIIDGLLHRMGKVAL